MNTNDLRMECSRLEDAIREYEFEYNLVANAGCLECLDNAFYTEYDSLNDRLCIARLDLAFRTNEPEGAEEDLFDEVFRTDGDSKHRKRKGKRK